MYKSWLKIIKKKVQDGVRACKWSSLSEILCKGAFEVFLAYRRSFKRHTNISLFIIYICRYNYIYSYIYTFMFIFIYSLIFMYMNITLVFKASLYFLFHLVYFNAHEYIRDLVLSTCKIFRKRGVGEGGGSVMTSEMVLRCLGQDRILLCSSFAAIQLLFT